MSATPPHVLTPPTGDVKTIRCSCGERFRAVYRACTHADVLNLNWRTETGEDDRPARQAVVPYE
ncbi:hypothetical protein [Curtobacterium aurantiacum]|uniref:hypothetical protein n=1 Tax=Curtobacterium aurantiacum TaxID=3236919 RepID=UPI001BE0FFA3|nr:hypothetical protein [Curtobacterium flaccumfaciens]MBT1675995.1 hypothetical protein [Curtobacterium flaccumfaciens pv. flaccumfaciens]